MSDRRLFSPLVPLVTAAAAASLTVLVAAAIRWDDEDIVLLSALAGLAFICELLDFAPFGNTRISMSVALIMVAGTVAGLPGVAVVASVAAATDFVAHPKPAFKAVFNEGALLLSGCVYVGIFQAFSIGYGAENWPGLFGPAIVGGGLYFLVNSSLVACAIAVETGSHPLSTWNIRFPWLLPHYVIVGILAVMTATAYERWELAGLALLTVPLAMVWFVIRQYASLVASLGRPQSAS